MYMSTLALPNHYGDLQVSLDEFESNIDSAELAEVQLNNLYMDLSVLILGIIATLIVLTLPMFADANNDIMYVIDSPILRGRNDMVAKYSTWIAWGAQLIITACGFMIICLKTVTIGMTLLYLTHPRFWDGVSLAKANLMGNGDWLSTIVGFIVPDVKKYSEYGEIGDDAMYEVGGIATIGSYVKKNMVQFIVLVTLASVLWSGKLLKLVGGISQGCVAVVDWALAIDYGGKVNDMLEADRDYQFMYDKTDQAEVNKSKVAQALYSQVKTAVSDNRTSAFLNSAGAKITDLLGTGVLGKSTSLAGANATHVTWDNPTLTFTLTWNSEAPANHLDGGTVKTPDGGIGKGVWIIPMSQLWDGALKDTTTKQQQLHKSGAIYLSFNASQVYNGSEYGISKEEPPKTDDKKD